MRSVDPGLGFEEWRVKARELLVEGVLPGEVCWEVGGGGLFEEREVSRAGMEVGEIRVPAGFAEMARMVACHRDARRWGVLYRILWRLVRGGEGGLMRVASDPDVAKARGWEKGVRREIHKMHAFVRFRKVGESEDGRERMVAWFEPEHWIIREGAGFFQKRFAAMDWSIFSPKGCAHGIGGGLAFAPGVDEDPSGSEDVMEEIWRTYYRSIFNPARLKRKAMEAEMPKRYWKNLPEAGLIEELTRGSGRRVERMMEEEPRPVREARGVAYLEELREKSRGGGEGVDESEWSWEEMRRAAACCRRCPLAERASGTVFGEGPVVARVMVVGEQPGERDDLEGRPFAGAVGEMLEKVWGEVGLERGMMYVTHAVKHFRWRPGGGRGRLYERPGREELVACRPWLMMEWERVRPEVVVLLGETAAAAMFDREVSVLKERGWQEGPDSRVRWMVTEDPRAWLRLEEKKEAWERWREEWREVAKALRERC